MKNPEILTACAGGKTLLLGLLLAGGGLAPLASPATEYSPGYIYDMRGMVARDADGNCRRTSQWSPSNAIEACDPEVVAERSQDKPIRPAEARVTGVTAEVDVTALLAGEAFSFNSAELSEAGKHLLAEAVGSHADDYIHRVNVEGYTDDIGNPQYNLKLSQQRADAVKSQLVALGIPEERIRTEAMGSANPIVTCEGVTGEALIACLAPNRRTEVAFIVPKISTAAVAEMVATRRQEKVKESNISAVEVAVDTPLITRGFNEAMKIMGDGCSKEIAGFCGDVPLGGGRVLSCLKAHEGELSLECQTALTEGAATIDTALGNANFFGAKCGRDIKDQCASVQPGEGKMLGCLTEKINFVTKRCVDALLELGLIDESQYPFGKSKSATP
ncbi:MAG: OmpA family protein [Gammaproteobacteria bacterium]|jgi:OOP family OmpA-OmpF porin